MKRLGAWTALAVFLAAPLHAGDGSPVRLYGLRCEHLDRAVGIGTRTPRLSWKIRSDRPGEVQTAYAVRAAATRARLEAGRFDLWDSGRVDSARSVLVPSL